jgi:hypothetical protein
LGAPVTGPEHYREAERLLALTFSTDEAGTVRLDQPLLTAPIITALAQVHATLSLAAATALHAAGLYIDPDTRKAWRTAIKISVPEADQ